MTTMTIERGGTLTLPAEVQQQYGMLPETSVRLIETRSGLLLVPITNDPMSKELTAELAEWQALGQDAWAQFSYEDGTMNPGDVYWVEFPARAGHAQAGRRPAIVMQSASATAQLPKVLLFAVDNSDGRFAVPGTVLVEVTPKNGLKRPSVALAFQLTVADKQFIEQYIGTLSDKDREAVRQALDSIL